MSSQRTATRLSRLLSMLPWVVANPGTTMRELRDRFGYESETSLLKDLHLVFVCGLPGYGPGDLIDLSIDDDEVYIDLADYFANPLRLTAAEAIFLLAAGEAVLSSGTSPPSLDTAVAKLRSAIAPDAGVLDVGLDPEPEPTPILRRAAAEARVVRITHTSVSAGRTTVRDVEPWAVLTTLGNWYVSGHCRLAGAERVFRIDRIRQAEPLDETFTPPPEPPAPRVVYTPGPEAVTARIRLSPEAAWVAGYYPVVVLTAADDGSTEIEFSASDPGVTARLLLRLGAGAELLEGDEVAAAVADLRSRILARYR